MIIYDYSLIWIYNAYVGALGVICAILWIFLVYDSPARHPRISTEEQQYIEKALNRKVDKKVYINAIF